MEYRCLGHSGLKLSALSFGSWVTFANQLDASAARECMAMAYDAGVNFFDNAEVYAKGESEILMGAALRKLGWRRDSYTVSSKAFWGSVSDPAPTQCGLSRKHLTEACHQAMERLGVDYLDLFYCHRPDGDTPVEETVWAMHNLITQGKVLYWGTSEWPAHRIMEAHAAAARHNLIGPTMEQPQYNMFERARVESEYAQLYRSPGLGVTSFSPLASGLLTGKYNDASPSDTRISLPGYGWLASRFAGDEAQRNLDKVRQLKVVASELGCSLAQLGVAWCAANPRVTSVIMGASKAAQLEENLKAMDLIRKLDADVMEQIEAILNNKPQPESRA